METSTPVDSQQSGLTPLSYALANGLTNVAEALQAAAAVAAEAAAAAQANGAVREPSEPARPAAHWVLSVTRLCVSYQCPVAMLQGAAYGRPEAEKMAEQVAQEAAATAPETPAAAPARHGRTPPAAVRDAKAGITISINMPEDGSCSVHINVSAGGAETLVKVNNATAANAREERGSNYIRPKTGPAAGGTMKAKAVNPAIGDSAMRTAVTADFEEAGSIVSQEMTSPLVNVISSAAASASNGSASLGAQHRAYGVQQPKRPCKRPRISVSDAAGSAT
ncbi:hypothetical protein TSOC_012905 [Tetrabaena socialis]|uniref:Uncharacterized protein n=1 Tax=Tetrabaena socialis TaxID=47790 RepID=A0A2J7ZLS3_9CHLO|nr:hypothetical protein TSOC_012905 [Tetrabaena socialis]|eukprot:PNH01223.1 hypothetical protein TSOC_012905 [Tetrabaena socialis]